MIQTVEAVIDSSGRVLLLEDVSLPKGHRALITVLDERADVGTLGSALLSEEALAEDWLRPEEDKAWSHLQLEPLVKGSRTFPRAGVDGLSIDQNKGAEFSSLCP